VKAAILIGPVALAIGATALHNNGMNISDIIGSKAVGLQCQYADVTEYYSTSGGSTTSTTEQHTTVIELSGRTWRTVTFDGKSWKELLEHDAKANGKKMDGVTLDTPLRVTDETYVLMEPHEDPDAYAFKNNGWYVDRISGTMTGESWTREKGAHHWDGHLTSNGHCSPIDINAKL
jgi:hypothetical protein